ncbi:hypothetical protein [Streptomyces thioluteus]|uniref:hypothetical protein n=1 Tax=Streptomyces thioluteus TaxID=66431 RepID=UPI0031EF242F
MTDPTVVLAGAKSHTAHDSLRADGTLLCRIPAQIFDGGRPNPYTDVKTDGLPAVASALLSEFASLLDPVNAGKIPAGLVPEPWRQPWKPLLFPVAGQALARALRQHDRAQLAVRRQHLPLGAGLRHRPGGGDRPPLPRPAAAAHLSSGLERHAADHHDPAVAEAFTEAAAQVKDLDLLSQRLRRAHRRLRPARPRAEPQPARQDGRARRRRVQPPCPTPGRCPSRSGAGCRPGSPRSGPDSSR